MVLICAVAKNGGLLLRILATTSLADIVRLICAVAKNRGYIPLQIDRVAPAGKASTLLDHQTHRSSQPEKRLFIHFILLFRFSVI